MCLLLVPVNSQYNIYVNYHEYNEIVKMIVKYLKDERIQFETIEYNAFQNDTIQYKY